MNEDDIKLILKDLLDPNNFRIVDITYLLIYLYLIDKNIKKIQLKPILLLFLPQLLHLRTLKTPIFKQIISHLLEIIHL